MREEIARSIAKGDTKNWKRIEVEFGNEFLEISVPPECETLHMKKMPHLANSREEVFKALNNPIGTSTRSRSALRFLISPVRFPTRGRTGFSYPFSKYSKVRGLRGIT